MDEKERKEVLARIEELRSLHRQLDTKIATLVSEPVTDQLHIRRLKKQKLKIRDEIAALDNLLFPDIIA